MWEESIMKSAKDRYCFFDIDGVLNKSSDWRVKLYSLDIECVKLFCAFVKKYDLKLIIISSWRSGFISSGNLNNSINIKTLEDILSKYDVQIYSSTPILKGKSRDYEIKRFLFYHPSEQYVILDDDLSEYEEVPLKLILTDSNKGLTKSDLSKARKFLNN